MPPKRRTSDAREWHERMMAQGPPISLHKYGVKTWEDLHEVSVEFIAKWERQPPLIQQAYAFPNPEDRKPNVQP